MITRNNSLRLASLILILLLVNLLVRDGHAAQVMRDGNEVHIKLDNSCTVIITDRDWKERFAADVRAGYSMKWNGRCNAGLIDGEGTLETSTPGSANFTDYTGSASRGRFVGKWFGGVRGEAGLAFTFDNSGNQVAVTSEPSPSDKARAAALFSGAFQSLQNREYEVAREAFEAGLKLSPQDVNAWLFYRETLGTLKELAKAKSDYDSVSSIGQKEMRAHSKVREIKATEAQMITLLTHSYETYHDSFSGSVAAFRMAAVVGKRVCAWVYPDVREFLARNGATVIGLDGPAYQESLRSFNGRCDVGVQRRRVE